MLRLSTVSRTSQLSPTVSLAATATTTNHCTLPCPALPRPPLHWRLSVLACCGWFFGDGASSPQIWDWWSFPLFRNARIYLFPSCPLLSSHFPAALSLSPSLSLSFSLSTFLSGRGACGAVGRGLIPSARSFCQRLVPFCVMVLTERTPHLTPIELRGWAAGQPGAG